jgi:hypothetical protein
MKAINRNHWILAGITMLCLVAFGAFVPAAARSASAIAKGYASDDTGLQPGMTVALSDAGTADKPKVKRAAQDDEEKIIGVATLPESELLTIASGEKSVYVQITGEADAFVSDLDGEIKKGDLLTISPVLGVLTKANRTTATVLGIALEDFDASKAETKTVEGENGPREVKIGKTKINLDHKAASNQQADSTDSSLERLGRAVVGRNDVTEIQVIAGLTVFLIVLVTEGAIMYGAISSSIMALGRNPMAHKIILGELVRVLAIAFGVLIVGLAAIYVILWI